MYYIENNRIALLPYTHADDPDMYTCWLDTETQRGYNCQFRLSFEDFSNTDISFFPFWAVVWDKAAHARIGVLRLGPDADAPYLAVWIYPPYRNRGLGTQSFQLAIDHIFAAFPYSAISAGCYEDNIRSLKMLRKLGFFRVPEDILEENCFTGESIHQLVFQVSRDQWNQRKRSI